LSLAGKRRERQATGYQDELGAEKRLLTRCNFLIRIDIWAHCSRRPLTLAIL